MQNVNQQGFSRNSDFRYQSVAKLCWQPAPSSRFAEEIHDISLVSWSRPLTAADTLGAGAEVFVDDVGVEAEAPFHGLLP